MGTSLDIKIKRANKVYHAGVSGMGGPAGFVGSRTPLTLSVRGRGRGVSPKCVVHGDRCPTETPPTESPCVRGLVGSGSATGTAAPSALNIRLRLGSRA